VILPESFSAAGGRYANKKRRCRVFFICMCLVLFLAGVIALAVKFVNENAEVKAAAKKAAAARATQLIDRFLK
jgi:hypothetical protein